MKLLRRSLLAMACATLAITIPAIAPAIASAQSVGTQPASSIGLDWVTLNGTTSGYPSDTSDYCSFAYYADGGTPAIVENEPASSCNNGTYSMYLTGLSADTTYTYYAVQCASTAIEDFQTVCAGSAPVLTDPCAQSGGCQTFTTSSVAAGSMTLATQSATGVGIASATLHATGYNFPAGSECLFAYASAETPGIAVGANPQPCNGSYAALLTGLFPNTMYVFWALECTATSSGFDCSEAASVDPCAQSGVCPTFTTGVPTGTTDSPTDTGVCPTPGTTDSPTTVGGSSATLCATLHIEDLTSAQSGVGSETVGYYFEYSTDPSFKVYASTPVETLSPTNIDSNVQVSAAVDGLDPGTTYYARIVVTDKELANTNWSSGTSYGNTVTFITGGAVITEPATAINGSGATLNGEVVAGDDPLGYYWVYSTTLPSSGDQLIGVSTVPSGGAGEVLPGRSSAVSFKVAGLAAATSYYFQLVGVDTVTGNQILGAVRSFTTVGASCPSAAGSVSDQPVPGTGFVVSGCFAVNGAAPSSANDPAPSAATWVGYGNVMINGVSFSGALTQTVQISGSQLTLASGYALQVDNFTLYAGGSTHFDYTDKTVTGSGASYYDSTVTVESDPSASWFGFPMIGSWTITAHGAGDTSNPGGASISVPVLGFPALFGGVTADGSATLDASGTATQVSVTLGDSTIGPLSLPELSLTYGGSDTWSGVADLDLPLASVGITGTFTIVNDKLTALAGSYSGPGFPLGPTGVEVNGVMFNATFNPFSLGGGVGVGFGPEFEGTNLFEGSVNLTIAYNSDQQIFGVPGIADGYVLRNVPTAVNLTGSLQLLGFIQIASGTANVYHLGPHSTLVTASASLTQALNVHCASWAGGGTLGLSPSLQIAGDGESGDFNLQGSGGLGVSLCGLGSDSVSGSATISSKGFAICGDVNIRGVYNGEVGMGGDWPSSPPTDLTQLLNNVQFIPSNCDATPYEYHLSPTTSAARAGRRAGATLGALNLPGGLPFAVVRVTGVGAPPRVSVSGPHGLRIRMALGHAALASYGHYLVIPDGGNDTTYIVLTRPPRGSYRLAPEPGSAAVARIAAAHGLPAPAVHATISGHGATRTLSWRARAIQGQRLVFRELGAAGDRKLIATRKAAGTLRYRLTAGLAGKRFLEVQVFNDGALEKIMRLASYTGPVVAVPRRPHKLEAVRSGTRLTVTWSESGERPSRYLAYVSYPDHARKLSIVRSPKLVVRGVPATGKLTVTVSAENELGRRGRSASATAVKPRKTKKRARKNTKR